MKKQTRGTVDCPECEGRGEIFAGRAADGAIHDRPCPNPYCEDGQMLDPDFTVNDGRRAFCAAQRIPCGRRPSRSLGLLLLRRLQWRRRLESVRATWPPRQPTPAELLEIQAMQGAYGIALGCARRAA